MSTSTNNTRKMAYIAILSAISFVLMYFQIQLLPTVNFLKLDFSIIPILVGLVVLDLGSAFWILLIRSVLQLLINNKGASTIIGMPMNIAAYAFFILALAFIWKKAPSVKTYIKACLVGTIALTAGMMVLNYVYALPLYKMFAGFDVAAMVGSASNYIFSIVLPFNLLQGIIFSVVFYVFYQAMQPIFKNI